MGQTAQSNDLFFDESFESALPYQVPTKTKDGDLLHYFQLFGSTMDTHHERHHTGTIGSILGLRDLCSPSGYEPYPPKELPIIPPENSSETLNDQLNTTALAVLSVLSEGGEEQESCISTPCINTTTANQT